MRTSTALAIALRRASAARLRSAPSTPPTPPLKDLGQDRAERVEFLERVAHHAHSTRARDLEAAHDFELADEAHEECGRQERVAELFDVAPARGGGGREPTREEFRDYKS